MENALKDRMSFLQAQERSGLTAYLPNEELEALRDELLKSEERIRFLESLVDCYADLVKKQIDFIRMLASKRG